MSKRPPDPPALAALRHVPSPLCRLSHFFCRLLRADYRTVTEKARIAHLRPNTIAHLLTPGAVFRLGPRMKDGIQRLADAMGVGTGPATPNLLWEPDVELPPQPAGTTPAPPAPDQVLGDDEELER
jgi:hypothetical protein